MKYLKKVIMASEQQFDFVIMQEDGRTERTRHGDDVALKGAVHDVPRALVDDEGRLAVVFGVLVGLRDDPCGCIRDALSRSNENSTETPREGQR